MSLILEPPVTVADPFASLMEARNSIKGAWVTFDLEHLDFFKEIFERIHGQGKVILEVGAGFGFTCCLFGLLGAKEAHGVELIDHAVDGANQVRDHVDPNLPVFFKQHNASEPLPYPDETFDALLLIEAISHVIFDDTRAFLSEMARVLKPGGILYISDGNNACSPSRRKQNQQIWDRFENGPPTKPGETVHTHLVKKAYVESRREIAEEAVPGLNPADYEKIARNTFCFTADEIAKAAKEYAQNGTLPASRYKPGVCPIDPVSEIYIEKMFDPFELCDIMRSLGFTIEILTTRRSFPLQGVLDCVPRLTMLVSNGFVISAKKQ